VRVTTAVTTAGGVSARPVAVVHEGRWALISAGEYDPGRHAITINLSVVDAVCARFGDRPALVKGAILAHEAVHATRASGSTAGDEEAMARRAACETAGHRVVEHIEAVLAGAWT